MIPIIPLLLSILVIYIANFYRNVRKYPKGPFPLPFIGNLYQIRDSAKINLQFIEWSKTYGNVFTVYLPSPWVLVMDYEGIKEALVTKGDDLVGRSGTFPEDMFMSTPNGGLIFSQGESWVLQRRTSIHILRDFGMGKNLMEHKVKLSIQEFCNYIDSLEDRSKVDLRWPLQLMIGNIINQILYGWHYAYNNYDKLKGFCDRIDFIFTESTEDMLVFVAMAFPWIKHIPFIGYAAYGKYMDQIKVSHDMIAEDVRDCLKTFNPDDEPECLVHEYNQRILTGNEAGLNFSQLCNVASDFFGAGMETTTTTLRWAVTFMAARQDVQDEIREEIFSVVGRDTPVTMSDRLKMPNLNATIYEIQRRGNVFPLNIFHRTVRDTEICGHLVPENTIVLPQLDSVLRTDPIFENPEEFRPKRFLMDDGKTLNKAAMDRVIPFSMGKRQCAGESLARMELFLSLATILQKYRILPHNDETISLEPKWSAVLAPQQYYFKIENV